MLMLQLDKAMIKNDFLQNEIRKCRETVLKMHSGKM